MDFEDAFGIGDAAGGAFDEAAGPGGEAGGPNEASDDLFMFTGMNADEIEAYKDMKDSVVFLIDCHQSMYN